MRVAMPDEIRPLHPLARSFRRALAAACRRNRRKGGKLGDELQAADDAETLRECGELLKAHLDAVPRGEEVVELPDLYRPGRTRRIQIDPALRPMDNARRYFKKYRKLVRGRERIAEQLERCTQRGSQLDALLERFRAWAETAAPEDLPPQDLTEQAADVRVHVQGLSPPVRKGPQRSAMPEVRRFTSRDGMRILVGKGATDNDRLSFDIACGNDWWFHAAHTSGSHVVVKGTDVSGLTPRQKGRGKKEAHFLPQETLLDAATLAVHFSKARGASKAEVHYTQAKHLRKSRRAPPGEVTLQQHQTVLVRMESKRLQRLVERDEAADHQA